MSDPEPTNDGHVIHRADQLRRLVSTAQGAYRQQHADALQAALAALFELFQPDIKRQCAHWLKMFPQIDGAGPSAFSVAVDQLTMNIFADIIDDLLKITLDPSRNAYGLVMTMIHHALYDRNQRQRRGLRQREATDTPITPGDPRASMAPPPAPAHQGLSFDSSGALVEAPDPTSDFTERILERERLRRYWSSVQHFKQRMSKIDQIIFEARWGSETPMPFEAIARSLGDGWTMMAVKQRHHRLINQLRRYIRRDHGANEGDW